MCYCLLSGLMLFCALQGRGCYDRRRGKTEDVLFFMWLQCVASMYCQWMYVSVYVFVIVLCLQGIGPRGPDSRPQRHAEPTFTKGKRFGAMWYREKCWCCSVCVNLLIIYLLMLFVFVSIPGIAPSRVWIWHVEDYCKEEEDLAHHCKTLWRTHALSVCALYCCLVVIAWCILCSCSCVMHS